MHDSPTTAGPVGPTVNDSGRNATGSGRAIPPPPPPRSTLVPVTPPSASIDAAPMASQGSAPPLIAPNASAPPTVPVGGGIGTVRGVRWRGEADVHVNAAVGNSPVGNSSADPDATSGRNQTSGRALVDGPPRSRLRSAPPWLISTVLHLVLLIVLALLTYPVGSELGTLLVVIDGDRGGEIETLQEFEIEELQPSMTEDLMANEVPETFEPVDVTPVEMPPAVQWTPQTLAAVGPSAAAPEATPMFSGRSGSMKKALLAAFGGTEQTEDAVALGLRWIVDQQMRDGGWSMLGPYQTGGFQESRIAATSMAILALAGAGNTHQSGEYQVNVDKALRWLVKQHRGGQFTHGRSGHHRTYGQAQAMIAINELYAMTGDSWLRGYCQQAINYARKAQSDRGGWRYQPGGGSDMSVTGWYVMGLQSALQTDLDVPMSSLTQVRYYLDDIGVAGGAGYPYQKGGGESPTMTAEGLLCRQYLGWDREVEEMQIGVAALLADFNFDIDQGDVYQWYYITQLLHHYGGSSWRMWNDRMKEQLPRAQIKRGVNRGSWPPQSDRYGANWGRLYTTCLSIYCLEVYYRHLPLYGLQITESS